MWQFSVPEAQESAVKTTVNEAIYGELVKINAEQVIKENTYTNTTDDADANDGGGDETNPNVATSDPIACLPDDITAQ